MKWVPIRVILSDPGNVFFLVTVSTFFFMSAIVILFVYYKLKYKDRILQKESEPIAEEFDIDGYLENVTSMLGDAWQSSYKESPKLDQEYATAVKFKIMRDGTLEEIEITEPSGWKTMDESILVSLNKQSPILPLPEDFKEDFVEIEMSFQFS